MLEAELTGERFDRHQAEVVAIGEALPLLILHSPVEQIARPEVRIKELSPPGAKTSSRTCTTSPGAAKRTCAAEAAAVTVGDSAGRRACAWAKLEIRMSNHRLRLR